MKITVTQLRNIIKTEVKRLGGKGLNEALPRTGRADGLPGPVDDESDRARERRGRAPMPKKMSAEGTVGWLMSQLRKMPADLPVMFGDDAFQVAGIVDIKNLDDDGIETEDGGGDDVVCITS